jgi:predicted Zn-dependent protease
MPEAVVAQPTDGSAQLQLMPGQGSAVQAVQQFIGQQGITVRSSQQTTINGLPAAVADFDAQTEQGTIRGLIAGIQYNNSTYLIVGLMAQQAVNSRAPEIEATIRSFRPLTDQAALNVQPARLKIITLPETMSAQTFVQRYPSSIPAEQVYIINGVEANTTLQRGMLVKQVVGGIAQH